MGETKLSKEEQSLYYTMIWFYRRYPVQATRDLLGIRLSIHQGIALKMLWKKEPSVVLFCGRGTSKTFLLGLYAVLTALLYPNEKCVCVGSGFRQSKEILLEACEKMITCELASQEQVWFAKKSLKPRASPSVVIKAPDAYRIDFVNGSFIVGVPLSKSGDAETGGGGNNIRGYRASKLLLDEVKDIPPHVISKVLEPMGIVQTDPTGEVDTGETQTVFAGTIDFESSHYWSIIQDHRKSMHDSDDPYHEDRNLISFDYEDTYWLDKDGVKHNWSIPYRMSLKKIMRQRDSGETPLEDWESEYKCKPIRNTGTYYPYELMTSAANYMTTSDPKDIEDEQYLFPKLSDKSTPVAIGVDVGRTDDFFAIVVVALNQLDDRKWNDKTQTGHADFNHAIYVFQERNMTYANQALKLRDVMKKFPNFMMVTIDARGGDALLDELAFNAPKGELPIFDPDDEDRTSKLEDVHTGVTKVRSIKATDVLNNLWNSFMKSQFEHKALFIPKPMDRDPISELEDVHRNMDKLKYQFIKLKTKVGAKNNMYSFFMDNPKKHKKDMYSGFLYAMAGVREFLLDEELMEDQPAFAAFVGGASSKIKIPKKKIFKDHRFQDQFRN